MGFDTLPFLVRSPETLRLDGSVVATCQPDAVFTDRLIEWTGRSYVQTSSFYSLLKPKRIYTQAAERSASIRVHKVIGSIATPDSKHCKRLISPILVRYNSEAGQALCHFSLVQDSN